MENISAIWSLYFTKIKILNNLNHTTNYIESNAIIDTTIYVRIRILPISNSTDLWKGWNILVTMNINYEEGYYCDLFQGRIHWVNK